jgi:hypothetical protein
MKATNSTSTRSTVAADLKRIADAKAANPKAKNVKAGALGLNLNPEGKEVSTVVPVASAAKAKPGKPSAVKPVTVTPAKAIVDLAIAEAAKVATATLKAQEKAEAALLYAKKIEDQKAATIKRHRDIKLMNSFKARVKYMLYMDSPALGGLDGVEQLGWDLTYTNSTGHILRISRNGSTIASAVNGVLVDSGPATEEVALALMATWTA